MKEEQTIIPVQLTDNRSTKKSGCGDKNSNPSQLACQLKMNGSEILFYKGVDKHILHAVLAEVRNAR